MKLINDYTAGYCEEGQAHPFHMILCKKEGGNFVALHNWIKCRDFVAEAIFSELVGKPKCIYGFGWKDWYETKPLTKSRRLYMAVKGTDKDIENLEKNLAVIQDLDKLMGSKSPTLTVHHEGQAVVLSSPSHWKASPTLLNFYTLLVKTCMFNIEATNLAGLVDAVLETEDGTYQRERGYWSIITSSGLDKVYTMLMSWKMVFDIDWTHHTDVGTSSLHHGHGPVSFFQAVKWELDQKGGSQGACPVIQESVRRVVEIAAA